MFWKGPDWYGQRVGITGHVQEIKLDEKMDTNVTHRGRAYTKRNGPYEERRGKRGDRGRPVTDE